MRTRTDRRSLIQGSIDNHKIFLPRAPFYESLRRCLASSGDDRDRTGNLLVPNKALERFAVCPYFFGAAVGGAFGDRVFFLAAAVSGA